MNKELNQIEKDIQALCDAILKMELEYTDSYGIGTKCPFCNIKSNWKSHMSTIKHDSDCVYLIAKDLKTNF